MDAAFHTCCSRPSAQPLCPVKSWLTSPALSSVRSKQSVIYESILRYFPSIDEEILKFELYIMFIKSAEC